MTAVAPLHTFADVKRRCQLGTRLTMIFHYARPDMAPMTRVITRVQTNAIAMSPWPGKSGDSWLRWDGGAKDIRIDGADTFSVLEDGQLLITYRFD